MPNPESLGAWKQEWETGDRVVARQLAENYVDTHREELEGRFAHMTLEECVKLVDMYRSAKNTEQRLTVDIWLMSEYPPQRIGGTAEVVLSRGQK